MLMAELLIASIVSYLCGSLSSAIIFCKLFGLPDPRTQGSKNPGATNVLRLGGKKIAILTLLGDMLKGFIPVIIGYYLGFDELTLSAMAVAAFIGHLFPIFFRFQGGKGVATAIGCIFAISLPVGLASAITWLCVAVLTRYSSLASICLAIFSPLYFWLYTHSLTYLVMMIIISVLLLERHRGNMARLFSGTESKIGNKN